MVIRKGFEFLTLGGMFLGVKNNSKNFGNKKILEGLKVEWPLSRKSSIEVKPMISDGHLKFCMTTYNLWMATLKQRSYQQLS